MFGVLALRAGIVDALLGLIALLVVGFSVYPLIVWSGRRAEARRRATGAAPSWPAQLPVVVAKMWELNGSGRHSGQPEAGLLFGRLVYSGESLRWEPGKSQRKKGTAPITWDRSWSPEVVKIWGPGSQGCLTLTRADGFAIDVWVNNPADLRRTLGLAETH
jgi:hypothetical protein